MALISNAPLIGVVVDFIIYTSLSLLHFAPANAQVVSFLIAGVFYYGCSFSFRTILKNEERWNLSQILYVAGFGCMVLSLRGGMIYAGTSAVDLHPTISFLPALLVTVLCNFLYIRFVKVGDEDSSRHFTFFVFAAGTFMVLVRLLYLGALELIPEEAYYWNYAEHLSAGYIDHPPMVGWFIALGVRWFGLNEFGVRIFAWVSILMGVLFLCLLHVRLFGKQYALVTGALALSMPYVFGAGFFISPDAGLFLFWCLSLYLLHRSLTEGQLFDWILLGMAVGLGLLSKYTICLLGLPAVVLMLVVPEWRRHLRTIGPYLSVFVAILFFTPVIYWNWKHEWASFTFQSTRRLESVNKFSLHSLFIDMMSLGTPAIFFCVVILLCVSSVRQKFEKQRYLFCVYCFLLPASVFIFYSLRHVPKLNWTGPSLISMIPLITVWVLSAISNKSEVKPVERLGLKLIQPIFVVWLATAGLLLHYFGIGLPLIPYSEKMHRIIGWRKMVEAVLDVSNRVQAEVGEKPVLIGMDKHTIASEISFYGAKRLGREEMNRIGSRNIIGEEALMFRFWSDPKDFQGKTMILVAKDSKDLSDASLEGAFEKVGPITEIPVVTGWSKTKTYQYRVGYRYKGPPNDAGEAKPTFNPAPPAINQS